MKFTTDSFTQNENKPEIPDHELIKCIGHGSFGQVWLARTITGSWRAIKIIWKNSIDEESCLKREYDGLQKYEPISRECPSLVAILHAGRNDHAGYFFYSMELADPMHVVEPFDPQHYKSKTLRSRLKQEKRLTVQETINIGIALCEALNDLHRHELVHRDIKPSNVIYVKDTPKLADIGLIADLDSTVSFVGTEGYVAPEGPGSAQSDIYSLGKLLYETSTGLDRKQYPELPAEIADMMDPTEQEKFMSLQAIIDKACIHDARKRYNSAKNMLADLVRLSEGKSIRLQRSPLFSPYLILMMLLISGGLIYLAKRLYFQPSNTAGDESTNFLHTPRFAEQIIPVGMVSLPSGSFVMGDALGDGITNALPAHTIYLDAFFMDKYETTQELWNSVANYAKNQGYNFTGPWAGEAKAINHPVHSTSWFDAVKWCNARSQFEGRTPVYYDDPAFETVYKTGDKIPYVQWKAQGYRLPTEAEWEYAARGGVTNHSRFSWGNTITHTQANYSSEIGCTHDTSETRGYHPTYNDGIQPYTSPVGSFAPNAYGLYDMAGNIGEWCWDFYAEGYSSGGANNPNGPDSGLYRVKKGGSWVTGSGNVRPASRLYDAPDAPSFKATGFRTVMANHLQLVR